MGLSGVIYAQYPQNNFMMNQPNQNYLANSNVFRQEIARMEINVTRAGKGPLPITQVPRLEKGDILKFRLMDELVNGLKPDQSNYDWTFLVAFINPGLNDDIVQTVSEEINFKKKGWYKEHILVVPYDSQPIFFLYPKPQYRSKILKLINKNPDDIKKIGEKTIEIADAYGRIGMFLSELQTVVNRNYYRGLYNNYNYGGGVHSGGYNQNFYGGNVNNDGFIAEQAIERLASSFNIQLPGCWGGNNPYNYNQPGGSYYPNNNYYNNNYGYYNPYNYGMGNDLMARVQCIARSVRVEDFDISVARMIQQGGIFAASQLVQRYPQLAFWINIAAAALDFIFKVANKAPLKLIPTIVSANETQLGPGGMQNGMMDSTKISLFAESQPSDNGYVTAYPMVFHKWEANADPSMITLPMPVLMDSCLHAGQNIIRTTDVLNDWMTDNFTKNFQLNLSSVSGYQKVFNLRKNVGLGGWELMLSKEDLESIPKLNMQFEGFITGNRGFNKIQSPKFEVNLSNMGSWSIDTNSEKFFTVGGKRIITLNNQKGNCRCLEKVIYKPASGGEFVFEAKKLMFSPDGKSVSFEIDTTFFQNGQGQLELRHLGGDQTNLNLKILPQPPIITNVRVAKGDSEVVISGERLEQIQAIQMNGKRAVLKNSTANENTAVHSAALTQLREKVFVFEGENQWQEANNFSLELELADKIIIRQPTLFAVSPSRPLIVVNENKEIEGFIVNKTKIENSKNKLSDRITNLPIFSIEPSTIGVNIQNALTDFDFKVENLRIETRIENTPINPISPPDIEFEVLDWRSMKLNIHLSEQTRKILGGRRIQFRIIDVRRGSSDWFTIKQTFVRMPQINSLKCLNKECEIIGKGISYIQQISLDDGKTWFPKDPIGLNADSIGNDLERAKIPISIGNKSMIIKLRDFPTLEGIPVLIK